MRNPTDRRPGIPPRASAGRWARAVVGLLAAPLTASAQQVYQSVDAQGHAIFSDRAQAPQAQAIVVHPDPAHGPPPVIHFCWANCFTLTLDQRTYRRADGANESWTLERFTPSTIVLHRHDAPQAWNGLSSDVVYIGQIDNNHLHGMTVNGAAVPDIQMAWGPALDTLPGSNAERDQRHWTPLGGFAPLAPLAGDRDPALTQPEAQTSEPPPVLLIEEQPPVPVDGYLWTPGYWRWASGRYLWVAGAWLRPPHVGLWWTPGYWSWTGGVYTFHAGYWGPRVGYYGRINYGHGYDGDGYCGGRWAGAAFAYNTAVSNVRGSPVGHRYSEPVAATAAASRPSFSAAPTDKSAAVVPPVSARPHPARPSNAPPAVAPAGSSAAGVASSAKKAAPAAPTVAHAVPGASPRPSPPRDAAEPATVRQDTSRLVARAPAKTMPAKP